MSTLTRATTSLSDLLHDEQSLHLMANRERYEMADQSRVWVDAEHCEDLIRAAQQTACTIEQQTVLLLSHWV